MSNLNHEFHTCPDCSYQWRRGQHGGHSCIDRLKSEIEKLKKQQSVITSWESEFNDLVAERDEYRNAILGMSTMLKNREWANLLSTNDAISDLDVQITNFFVTN